MAGAEEIEATQPSTMQRSWLSPGMPLSLHPCSGPYRKVAPNYRKLLGPVRTPVKGGGAGVGECHCFLHASLTCFLFLSYLTRRLGLGPTRPRCLRPLCYPGTAGPFDTPGRTTRRGSPSPPPSPSHRILSHPTPFQSARIAPFPSPPRSLGVEPPQDLPT